MLYKRKIILCLGSSCFARGNNDLVPKVQAFIRKNRLGESVVFSGDHCFNSCNEGPNLKIGQKLYQHVSLDTIDDFLMDGLKDLIEK